MPLPDEDNVSEGKYKIIAFSPTQRPLDYIDYASPGEDDDEAWDQGMVHKQLKYEEPDDD